MDNELTHHKHAFMWSKLIGNKSYNIIILGYGHKLGYQDSNIIYPTHARVVISVTHSIFSCMACSKLTSLPLSMHMCDMS